MALLTPGTIYKFRLRARNTHGWGPYSSTVSMIPADKPSLMSAVSMT
jgi:hypothetical protein